MKVASKKKYGQMIELTDLLFNTDAYVAIMFGNNKKCRILHFKCVYNSVRQIHINKSNLYVVYYL